MEEIACDLESVERKIRSHPCLAALERGRIRREGLKRFAGEQYHIIQSDLRSAAFLVNRFGTSARGGSSCGASGWRRRGRRWRS